MNYLKGVNYLFKTMNAILVKQFGGPEVCEYVSNVPIPEPNDFQVNFLLIYRSLFWRWKLNRMKILWFKPELI